MINGINVKIIISVLAGLVLLGGVAYFVITKSTISPMGNKEVGGADAPAGQASFSALLRRGGSHMCTFSAVDPRVASKGVVYINDKSISGDFESDASALGAGQVLKSYMIRYDGYTYVWTDMFPQGFKIKDSGTADADTTDQPAQATLALDEGMAVSYDCKAWSVDPSKFIPPSTVTFSEGGLPVPAVIK